MPKWPRSGWSRLQLWTHLFPPSMLEQREYLMPTSLCRDSWHLHVGLLFQLNQPLVHIMHELSFWLLLLMWHSSFQSYGPIFLMFFYYLYEHFGLPMFPRQHLRCNLLFGLATDSMERNCWFNWLKKRSFNRRCIPLCCMYFLLWCILWTIQKSISVKLGWQVSGSSIYSLST